MAEILRVENLVKEFPVGGKLVLTAIKDVSLTLDEAETLGVVGESGSGKTTLGRCILRLHEPTRGKVYFQGEDITKLSDSRMRRLRSQMQIVYQNPWEAFDPRMSVAPIIEEPLKLHTNLGGKERRKEIDRLIELVGLSPAYRNVNPKRLSAGDQQRVSIARAIATKPKLIILDEATSSLDLSVRLEIMELLEQLQKEFRLSYIFISHDLTAVLRVSHRVAIMYLGQILELGPTDGIFASPQQPYSRALLSSVMFPDPWASKRRLRLAGEIPSPINLPDGCPLASRCPLVEDPCYTVPPPKTDIKGKGPENGWWAACHPMAETQREEWEKKLLEIES